MGKHKQNPARSSARGRALLLAIFLILTSFTSLFMYTPQVKAATLPQGCSSSIVKTHDGNDFIPHAGMYKSPFGRTSDLCLGWATNGSYTDYSFQIAIQLASGADKKNPQVTVTDTNNVNVPMIQDDGNATLWISSVAFHVGSSSGVCDAGAKYNVKVDGSTIAPGSIPVCSGQPNGDDKDLWVKTKNLDTGSTASRAFVGYVGINLGSPINTDPESQWQPLEQAGIAGVEIKVVNEACSDKTCTTDKSLVGASGGSVTINAAGLTANKSYTIRLTYDLPSVDVKKFGGVSSVWQSHDFIFDNGGKGFQLIPTGDTLFTPSDYSADNPAYYDEAGKVSKKTIADATVATTNCTVEGIGWIVCPVMTFLAGVNDVLYKTLVNFVDINPTIFGSNGSSGLYSAWNIFRTYANILFIVAFLIIVYSQITSVGITNYGIKKLLPKLIIAAILVNTSYYICQIAVDISNIVGYGLKTLFTSIGAGIVVTGDTGTVLSFGTVIGAALTTGALVAGSIALVLAVSVPVVLAALLALLSVIVILIARQAVVILLIAVSPLAFVAWLLPNTEKLFKKWWDLFFAMLILFPVISLLFGAGALASGILATGNFGGDGGTAKLAALGVLTIPMFAVIPILTGMIKKLGAPGGIMGGWLSKSAARMGSKVKSESRLGRGINNALGFRAQTRASRQTRSLAGNAITSAPLGVLGGKGYKTHLTNQATALEDKDYEEGIKAAESRFGGMTFSQIEAQANDATANDVDRTAAIRHIMAKGNFAQRRKLVESSSTMTAHQRSAVSSGTMDRGDAAIYGASIGDAIKSGQVGGEADTKRFVAQNIADGKIKAEAMVHDADAAKLLADVVTGGEQFAIKDKNGNVVTRAITTTESDEVKKAADKALVLPATASKAGKIFTDQFDRIPPAAKSPTPPPAPTP